MKSANSDLIQAVNGGPLARASRPDRLIARSNGMCFKQVTTGECYRLRITELEGSVKTLDVQSRLEFARAAVAVLRALHISDRTMRYQEFAKAIGLMSDDEPWKVWHRKQIADVLRLVAAAE